MAGDIDSIGIDTWGADFGILDKKGQLLMPPVHYRDRRTEGMVGKAQEKFSAKELFQFVSPRVTQLSDGAQHPVMWGKFDDDMPVMVW